MAGYLLADSFGGLQQAENAQDSNRRQALASAMNAATSGLQFATEQSRRQQVMDFEAKQAALAQQNKESELALQKTKADWELKHWNDQNAIAQQYVGMQKDLTKAQTDAGTAAGNRERQAELSRAQEDALRGFPGMPSGMDPNDYVTTFYPNAKPGEAKAIAGTAIDTWQKQQEAHDRAEKVADTLNNFDILTKKKTASDAKLKALGFFNSSAADRAAAKEENDHLTAAQAQLQPIVQRLRDPKNPLMSSGLISPPADENGVWSNMTPVPRHSPLAKPAPEVPAGWTPTTGGEWLRPTPTTTGTSDNAGEMNIGAPVSATQSSGGSMKYPGPVYQRAYQLMGQGTDPATAMRTALSDFQQAQAAGSVP